MATIFVIFSLTAPSAYASSPATSFKIISKFSVPVNCCSSFIYANNKIFGIGTSSYTNDYESDVYVFSPSNNAILATIPMADPNYLLYDSIDKTVLVFGNYNFTYPSYCGTCNDIVSLSTTTYKVLRNTTFALLSIESYGFPANLASITYDSKNDELYAGSASCNGGTGDDCQVIVINAKTLATVKTILLATNSYYGEVWSVIYDSKNNEIFVSASDSAITLCGCYGEIATISGSTNTVISSQEADTGYMELDTSNNLLYAFGFGDEGIDVYNANEMGAGVTTIDPQLDGIGQYALIPANFALDGNLVSGMFYAGGCYAYGGIVNGGGCVGGDYSNGTYYAISGTTSGSKITSMSASTNASCLNPFWSGVSKLTYVECDSKLLIFSTSTGKLSGSVNVQGSIAVFNRLSDLLYLISGNTVYEIGT